MESVVEREEIAASETASAARNEATGALATTGLSAGYKPSQRNPGFV